MVRAPWPTILPTIERPELMEEASGAAEDAATERGPLCTDVESRWLSAVSLWDFPNMSLSYSLYLGMCRTSQRPGAALLPLYVLKASQTQPPPTEMLRMVVAPFRSCCKMPGLKTSQHDYQPRPAK